MSGMMRLAAGVAVLALAALPAGAQSAATNAGAKHEVMFTGGLRSSLIAAPVIGQPFSAQVVHKNVRTLANGTTISGHGHHFVARDAEGRMRVELRMAAGKNGEPDTVLVFVKDPVAQTITTWVSGPKITNKVASVVKIPEERTRTTVTVQPRPAENTSRPQPVVTTEDLGMDTFDGIPVSVVKTTTVVPVGRAGNDAPITRTSEVWTSADMKLVMKQQSDDPRTGEMTVEMESFSRAEPDPTLFRAPPGYVVKTVAQTMKELEEKLDASQN